MVSIGLTLKPSVLVSVPLIALMPLPMTELVMPEDDPAPLPPPPVTELIKLPSNAFVPPPLPPPPVTEFITPPRASLAPPPLLPSSVGSILKSDSSPSEVLAELAMLPRLAAPAAPSPLLSELVSTPVILLI